MDFTRFSLTEIVMPVLGAPWFGRAHKGLENLSSPCPLQRREPLLACRAWHRRSCQLQVRL
eukprot:2291708-Amphidinium_carterae.3